MYIRRMIAVVLVIIICITSALPILASDSIVSLTLEQKADSLNKIALLTGSAGGYNLDGYITRGEATTFIVKLLGKAKYVEENKSQLKLTKFPDVKESQWYAPFVGYCSENGIIGGYTNGNFGPKDRISEKAFLTMVLKTLGYAEFTGDEVYKKAHEVGLVTDESYLDKTDVNKEYKRGDVVELLYHVLNLNKKDSQISIIKSLIKEEAISIDSVIEAGFLTEADKLIVTEITPQSAMKILIKFNKNIQTLKDGDIKVNTYGNDSEILEASIFQQQENILIIKTSLQIAQKNYSITLSNITDNDNIKMASVVKEFTGFVQKEVKSDFFKIGKIQPVSNNIINISFTQPINVNAEYPSYYSIFDGDKEIIKGNTSNMLAKVSGTENNVVTLTLKNLKLDPDKEYQIKVSGELNSLYGVNLCESFGDTASFISINESNIEFAVNTIYALNNKAIRIDFSRSINPTIAQQIYSYYITNGNNVPIQIEKVVIAPDAASNGKSVIISLVGTLDISQNYSIMINNINDISRQYSITERKYSFYGKYTDAGTLDVANVKVIDPSTIDIYFNRELDSDSASKTTNFTFLGITNSAYSAFPTKIYFDKNEPKKVRIYIGNDKLLTYRNEYKLVVQPTLVDYMGNVLGKLLYASFPCNADIKVIRPYIGNAVIISKDAIKINFSKEISLESPNILTSNYLLEYIEGTDTIKKIPTSVNYIDATTMILKFDNINFTNKYTLRFSNLKDITGLNTSSGSEFDPVLVTLGSDK